MRTLLPPLLPVLAVIAVYAAVAGFDFVYDDQNALVDNDALRRGDFWQAAFGTYNSLSNRPLPCLALALEFRLGGGPGAMHVVGLVLHAINAVLVYAIARELLPRGAWVAALGATLWAVHPLGVDAVAYLTQQSMLWMACFALLSLLAVLRGIRSPHPGRWQALGIVACALAMASKEEAAGLPLLLVLALRAFGLASWRELGRHRGFVAGLAATWLALAACVLLGPRNPTVGYATVPPVSASQWLATEAHVLLHYVRSVFAPNDLRGMYDFAFARGLGDALGQLLVLAIAAALTALALPRLPRLAFAPAAFFVLLAPTSSVLPIVTEPCADRRMYLPLLAFVVPAAAWLSARLSPRTFAAVAAAAALALGVTTWRTAACYRDDATFVAHAAASNELKNGSFLAGRILAQHARILFASGRTAEAEDAVRRAMTCEAPGMAQRLAHANVLHAHQQLDAAERELRAVLRDYPGTPEVMGNLARVLLDRANGQDSAAQRTALDEAERLLQKAVAEAPLRPELPNTLGWLLHQRGRSDEALPWFDRALALQPDAVEPRRNRAIALLVMGRAHEALDTLQPLLRRERAVPLAAELAAEARRALGETGK